jgi:hypothetical protein
MAAMPAIPVPIAEPIAAMLKDIPISPSPVTIEIKITIAVII